MEPRPPPPQGRLGCHIHSTAPNCFPNRPHRDPAGRNLLPSEGGNQTQGAVFRRRRGTVFETEYVSAKTNTACLPLKEILTGSKQAKWTEKGEKNGREPWKVHFCSPFSGINEPQTAADTSPPPSVLHVVRKKGGVESWKPSAPVLLSLSGPAAVLSNRAAPSASRPRSPGGSLTEQRGNFEGRRKRILSLCCRSLCAIISIRSLFCPQLVNLTECLFLSALRAPSFTSAVLSAGADTNEALFF